MYTLGRVVLILSIAVAVTLAATFLLMNQRPAPPAVVLETHSPDFQTAFFRASRVYGKVGCGDQRLAELTAKFALAHYADPALAAAQVSVESSCNTLAVSPSGAIGLMQILPRQWSKTFDFSKINLFNEEDNLEVGISIQSSLIHQYGTRAGLARYFGSVPDVNGQTGAAYAAKIMQIAGVK